MSAVARTALMQNCSLRTNIGSVQTFRGREELKAGCCRHGDGYHQLYMSIPMAPAAHHNTSREHMKERKEPGKTDQIELWTTKSLEMLYLDQTVFPRIGPGVATLS